MVTDHLFDGALSLREPGRGYRVTVDTLILASFAAEARPRARVLVDLGAGVGALALCLHHLAMVGEMSLVEREASLCDLSRENLAAARRPGVVLCADLADGLPAQLRGVADVVVCNPPFFAEQAGQRGQTLRSRARSGEVSPFLVAAAAALGRRGAAFFVYPAPALADFLASAGRAALVAKRLRLVHAFPHSPARLVLVELRRAKPGGLVVEPPLVEWDAPGIRSAALGRVVSGARAEPRSRQRPRAP